MRCYAEILLLESCNAIFRISAVNTVLSSSIFPPISIRVAHSFRPITSFRLCFKCGVFGGRDFYRYLFHSKSAIPLHFRRFPLSPIFSVHHPFAKIRSNVKTTASLFPVWQNTFLPEEKRVTRLHFIRTKQR